MTRRCYIPDPPRDRAVIDGSEAHHLLHVLRVAPGDRIDLFDGRGNAYEATVTRCERASVEVEVGPAIPSPNRAAPEVVLGVALPKGDRQRWLVEKCTELGVASLVPIVTQRTVATPKGAAGKLQRYVIEACKQCGRNTLMHIAEPIAWQKWVEDTTDGPRLIAHPNAPTWSPTALGLQDRITFSIGPEGGFTEEELALASARGWQPIGLGPYVLRVETAAAACAALALLQPTPG